MLWPRPDRITRENYERIRVGMSSAEVEAILGGPPGDYRTVRTEDEMYPRCFDLDAMAWHVECDRDFEAYREPMWFGNQGIIRVIPDDIEAARSALKDANIRFEESELVTALLENKAGELAEVASKLANAGVNVQAFYVVGLEGELVEVAMAVDDVKTAKKTLE